MVVGVGVGGVVGGWWGLSRVSERIKIMPNNITGGILKGVVPANK